jgi:hypothetical protein
MHDNLRDAWQSIIDNNQQNVNCDCNSGYHEQQNYRVEVCMRSIHTLEHDYREITLFQQYRGNVLQRTVKNLQAKKNLKNYCVFLIPISIIVYTKSIRFEVAAPHPR